MENNIMPVPGNALDAAEFSALGLPAISGIVDYLKTREQSKTYRAEISAKRDVAVSAIKNRRKCIESFLERSFGEREKLFSAYFALADKASSSGDEKLLEIATDGILQVYSRSPVEFL